MSQMHSFSVFLGKESICLNRATVHCLNVLIGFIGDISMCNTLFFTITFIRLMFFFSSFGCTSMVLLTLHSIFILQFSRWSTISVI
jgi:hypothetical protein